VLMCSFAAAAPVEAQRTIDLRTQLVRPLGSIDGSCSVIGTEDSGRPDGLFGASSAVEISTGRIFVANIGTSEVLQFEPNGQFVGSTMRRGAGPGELSTPRSVYAVRTIMMHPYRSDSLLVFDATYRRVSVLAPSGKFVRDFSLGDNSYVGSRAYSVGSSI